MTTPSTVLRPASCAAHNSPPEPVASSLPLCIDLDGTLLTTDSLHEAVLAVTQADLRNLLLFPGWIATGRAQMKRQVAMRWKFDPATLPYNADMLVLLANQRAAGRWIVLCTAADHSIAEAVAGHLGLFDEVLASDGRHNLRGEAKATALVKRFGQGGFVYAGNDATDLPVWEAAAAAIVVCAPASVVRAAGARVLVEQVLPRRVHPAAAVLRAIRPYQWSKNLLCLVPILAAGSLVPEEWFFTVLAMLAFCAAASGIYVLNDLSDLTADRAHPRKRARPFAAGDLPLAWGMVLAAALLLAGLVLAVIAGVVPLLAGYAALSLLYTLKLKEAPLVDVFILAALYTLRVLTGGVASGHSVSLWLMGFAGFMFFSLGLIKRVSELKRLERAERTRADRRGYTVQDIGVLQQMGCSSSFASVVVLALYVQSDAALRAYALPQALWAAVPLMLFWQCRLWLATARGYMHDDPILYAARDVPSWLTLACLGLVALTARLVPGV